MPNIKQDYSKATYAWKENINYREHPEMYRIGKGEQGVLICEPYKSELLPHWRFKSPLIARKSSETIYQLFIEYLAKNDFVGADLARKFLQMGYTRARRYANYQGGKKYRADTGDLLPRGTGDALKAQSAALFYVKWQQAEQNQIYQRLKKAWQAQYG